jgi:HSP20 family protein
MASRELGQRHAGDCELVRRNDPLTYMQSQINRIFDDFWGGSRWPETAAFSPQLDVKETDKEIQVCAELPGIRDQGFGRRSE